ncbi:MAG: DNRLRE domain-containing protein [Gemmatimonadota bacterium]|jgi:hypothetical protein|nr:hypothetical protein [Gemmatimonadota bacterium]MDP6530116.1 DNRLRE domain-containing protein [Gemmatimonadota bacterium]MDP6801956.1 DNRLRE domain-containing protein [Gemmatimonadota bacterium]MDP7031304.1 DNRLRE domain-containing protein [Gemmatimonadota bacterium]
MTRDSHQRITRLLLSAVVLISLLAACGRRQDNTVGSTLIEDQAGGKGVRMAGVDFPDTSADFHLDLALGTAGSLESLLAGERHGVRATPVLRFSVFPDSGTTLDSAVLFFSVTSASGDADPVAFSVHRIDTESWTESMALNAHTDTTDTTDTVFSWMADTAAVIELPAATGGNALVPMTELAQFWTDNPDSNHGMVLSPMPGANALLEIASSESEVDTLSVQLHLYWTGADSAEVLTVPPTDDTYLMEKTPDWDSLTGFPGRITVARGVPARGILRFEMPELGDRATINRAELTLHADPSESDLDAFTLGAFRVSDTTWVSDGIHPDSLLVEGLVYDPQEVTAETDSLVLAVTGLVSRLYSMGNEGILLRATDERRDADYLRIYGYDTVDPAKTPRLQIWYTPGDSP